MKPNPDDEFTKLLRQAKAGDDTAILRLAEYWFRHEAGPFVKSEPLTYEIDLETDPAAIEIFNNYTTRPIIWDIWRRGGKLLLTITNWRSMKVKGFIGEIDSEYRTYVDCDFINDDGWIAGQDGLDGEFHHNYIAHQHGGYEREYDSEDLVTPIINLWAKNNPHVFILATKLEKNRDLQDTNKTLQNIQQQIEAFHSRLKFQIQKYLEDTFK